MVDVVERCCCCCICMLIMHCIPCCRSYFISQQHMYTLTSKNHLCTQNTTCIHMPSSSPQVATSILTNHPELVRDFYRARPDTVCAWFRGVDPRGLGYFSPGARALASYALGNRDLVCFGVCFGVCVLICFFTYVFCVQCRYVWACLGVCICCV